MDINNHNPMGTAHIASANVQAINLSDPYYQDFMNDLSDVVEKFIPKEPSGYGPELKFPILSHHIFNAIFTPGELFYSQFSDVRKTLYTIWKEHPDFNIVQFLINQLSTESGTNFVYATSHDPKNDSYIIDMLKSVIPATLTQKVTTWASELNLKIKNEIDSKATLSSKLIAILKSAVTDELSKYNFTLTDFPSIEKFLNSATPDAYADYKITMPADGSKKTLNLESLIMKKIQDLAISNPLYEGFKYLTNAPITLNNFVDMVVKFKTDIDNSIISLMKKKIEDVTTRTDFIDTYRQADLFDINNNWKQKEIDYFKFFPKLKPILEKYNIPYYISSTSKFRKPDGSTTFAESDKDAILDFSLTVNLNGKSNIFNLATNESIKILRITSARIAEYIEDKINNQQWDDTTYKKLIDSGAVADWATLANQLKNGTLSNISLSLDQLNDVINNGNPLIDQSVLDQLFKGSLIIPKLSDYDINFILSTTSSDLDPKWEGQTIKLSGTLETKDKSEPLVKMSLTYKQKFFTSYYEQYSKIPNPPISWKYKDYILAKSVEKISESPSSVLDWVLSKLTDYNDATSDLKKITGSLDKTRYTTSITQNTKVESNEIENYYIKINIYDKYFDHNYLIENHIPIIDLNNDANGAINFAEAYFEPIKLEVEKLVDGPVDYETIKKLFRSYDSKDPNSIFEVKNAYDLKPTFIYDKANNTLKITYTADSFDITASSEQDQINSFSKTISLRLDPATQPEIDAMRNAIKEEVKNAQAAINKQYPNVPPGSFESIYNDYDQQIKDILDNPDEVLTNKRLDSFIAKSKIDVVNKTKEIIDSMKLPPGVLKEILDTFKGNPDIINWVNDNVDVLAKLYAAGLDVQAIIKIVKSATLRNTLADLAKNNIELIRKIIEVLQNIKDDYPYGYFGAGAGLGIAGIAAGGASLALLNSSRKMKKMPSGKNAFKARKLLTLITGLVSILTLAGSAAIMAWFFIQGGGF